LGKPGYRAWKAGDLEVWKRYLEDGSIAVGLFNRGEQATDVTAEWAALGITGKQKVRDLWRQKDLGIFDSKYSSEVDKHGAVMLRMWPSE
jgi:alpha-galactosidase